MANVKRPFILSPEEFKALRKSTGLTQRALAATLGTSWFTISDYESGHRAAPKSYITMMRMIAAKREATLTGKKQAILDYLDAPFDVSL